MTLRKKRAIAGCRRALRYLTSQVELVAAHHRASTKTFADHFQKVGEPHKVIISAVAACKSRQKWTGANA